MGWRSPEDEALLKAIADACAHDRLHNVTSDVSSSTMTSSALAEVSAPGAYTCLNGSVQTSTVTSTVTSPPLLNGGNATLQSDINGSGSSGASSLKDSLPDQVDLPPQGKVSSLFFSPFSCFF